MYEDIPATEKPTQIVMEEITDLEELAKARMQRARFDRNTAWLQAHVAEVYPSYRGKCICIAGEELFVADTPEEVELPAEDEMRSCRFCGRETNLWVGTGKEVVQKSLTIT
jgi:hypothetical protein